MDSQNVKFTVFTPTYNRAHTIHRVYDSLKQQTYRDFEWLVIDDGSTDKTSSLLREWEGRGDFPIRYVWQENAGKHQAFRRAVELARGELFLPIDSDDAFTSDALQTMLAHWNGIPVSVRNGFTGIVTRSQDSNGKAYGRSFPKSPLDTNALDLRHRIKVRANLWGFHRTSVLREFPFPDDRDVRYVPENIVWDEIARKYQVRCINEYPRIYYQDSGNQLTKASPRETAKISKYILQMVDQNFDYFRYDPPTFAWRAALYVRYSLHRGDRDFLNYALFSNLGAYFLCALAVGPGLLLYGLDRLREVANSSSRTN
ncbi:glycosyltransferase family 2 protein [Thiocapsa rosea]|uniref:glycosyltransferase family 2 protein n=1 Tax=Thiocapsa rosea TaxID=69360 RepID=UPI001B8724FF|nr:glycosyltransferase family 2 protein [Thiocapsa rosea]